MEPIEIASAALERNLGWVRAADDKVAPIFAVNAAMLGVLGLRMPHLEQLSNFEFGLWLLASGALILSMVFLGGVAFPRLPGPADSVVYFGTAAAMKEADYITRLCAPGPGVDELAYDTARQAFRNAEIAKAKYGSLKRAMIALYVSVPFWLGALISTRHLG